jgi:DNA-binding NtrC family response regulator
LFRLNAVSIAVPPLRARPDDAIWLLRRFFRAASGRRPEPLRGISPLAEEAVAAHSWPGNVRELRNRVERAVVLAGGPRTARTVRRFRPCRRCATPPSAARSSGPWRKPPAGSAQPRTSFASPGRRFGRSALREDPMAYKRQIDRLPIIPADATRHNVVCHYCIVGCGYHAYSWR